MKRWVNYVSENLDVICQSKSHIHQEIMAIYDLISDVDNGGVIQYLMNDSSDSFQVIKEIFLNNDYKNGVEFSESIERKFSGNVPKNRDDRIDVIERMENYESGSDPFENEQILYGRIVNWLDEYADNLVVKIIDEI